MSDRIQDYQTIQDHIEMGHTFASITLALPFAKDAVQRADMETTLKALFEGSGYIRDVLDKHPDPISALASRGSGPCLMVLDRSLQIQPDKRMSDSIREISLCA